MLPPATVSARGSASRWEFLPTPTMALAGSTVPRAFGATRSAARRARSETPFGSPLAAQSADSGAHHVTGQQDRCTISVRLSNEGRELDL